MFEIIIICIVIMVIMNLLNKHQNKKILEKEERYSLNAAYRAEVLDKLGNIQRNTNHNPPEKTMTEKFLEINKEIIRKKELKNAIKNELGVE